MARIQSGDRDTRAPAPRRRLEGDKAWLRTAAFLAFAGVLVSLVVGLLHAEAGDANDHVASFTAYASSNIWTGVHLGQFVGMSLVIAGLVSLLWSVPEKVEA